MTASEEVTDTSCQTLCLCHARKAQTVHKPLRQISVLGSKALSVWRVCWVFLPNSTEDGETESTTNWHEILPTEATVGAIAWYQAQLWDNVMLPAKQKMHRRSWSVTSLFLRAGARESNCSSFCLAIQQVILFFNFKCFDITSSLWCRPILDCMPCAYWGQSAAALPCPHALLYASPAVLLLQRIP